MTSQKSIRASELIGKTIISNEKGRRFGEIADLSYVAETGELLNILISNATKYALDLKLEEDREGRLLIPFSSLRSVGDFVIISEEELV
jgi:sporulation protein YlmC with PRC-barrel domain